MKKTLAYILPSLIALNVLVACQESAKEGPANYELVIVDSIRVDRYGKDYIYDVDPINELILMASFMPPEKVMITDFRGEILHEFLIRPEGTDKHGMMIHTIFLGKDSLFMAINYDRPIIVNFDGDIIDKINTPFTPYKGNRGPDKISHVNKTHIVTNIEGRYEDDYKTQLELINRETKKLTPIITITESSMHYPLEYKGGLTFSSALYKDNFYVTEFREPALYHYQIKNDSAYLINETKLKLEDFEASVFHEGPNNPNYVNKYTGDIKEIFVDENHIYYTYNSGISEKSYVENDIASNPMSALGFIKNYMLVLDKALKPISNTVTIPKAVRSLKSLVGDQRFIGQKNDYFFEEEDFYTFYILELREVE